MDILSAPLSIKAILTAALMLGFAPALVVRICTTAWPKGHPRRAELMAELMAVEYWKRPIWAAEQIESALFDGLRTRWIQRPARPVPIEARATRSEKLIVGAKLINKATEAVVRAAFDASSSVVRAVFESTESLMSWLVTKTNSRR